MCTRRTSIRHMYTRRMSIRRMSIRRTCTRRACPVGTSAKTYSSRADALQWSAAPTFLVGLHPLMHARMIRFGVGSARVSGICVRSTRLRTSATPVAGSWTPNTGSSSFTVNRWLPWCLAGPTDSHRSFASKDHGDTINGSRVSCRFVRVGLALCTSRSCN